MGKKTKKIAYTKKILGKTSIKKGAVKKEKTAMPRTVLFVSFSDSEKEIGCGAKPHCYRIR